MAALDEELRIAERSAQAIGSFKASSAADAILYWRPSRDGMPITTASILAMNGNFTLIACSTPPIAVVGATLMPNNSRPSNMAIRCLRMLILRTKTKTGSSAAANSSMRQAHSFCASIKTATVRLPLTNSSHPPNRPSSRDVDGEAERVVKRGTHGGQCAVRQARNALGAERLRSPELHFLGEMS